MRRHIAWDIGIAGVGRILADALGAALIQQNYSRLVIDCNRPPGMPSSIAGSKRADPNSRQCRLERRRQGARAPSEIFYPYHERIDTETRTPAAGAHAGGADLAAQLYAELQGRGAAVACRAAVQPRSAAWRAICSRCSKPSRAWWSATTSRTASAMRPITPSRFTASARGLPHALIEIRQDLIATSAASTTGRSSRAAAAEGLCRYCGNLAAVRTRLRTATYKNKLPVWSRNEHGGAGVSVSGAGLMARLTQSYVHGASTTPLIGDTIGVHFDKAAARWGGPRCADRAAAERALDLCAS